MKKKAEIVCLNQYNTQLALMDSEIILHIFDLPSKKQILSLDIKEILEPTLIIKDIQFSKNSNFIVIVTNEPSAFLIDLSEKKATIKQIYTPKEKIKKCFKN